MNPDFKLDSDAIANLDETYDNGAKNTIDAKIKYMKDIESIIGKGWKGRASQKFQAVIEDYEHCTQYFINEIMYRKSVMQEALSQFDIIDNNAKQVGDNLKNISDERQNKSDGLNELNNMYNGERKAHERIE